MNKKLEDALVAVDFVNRLQEINNNHSKEDIDDYFRRPNTEIVCIIIESLGYNVKCYQNGKFYKITDKVKNKYNTFLQPVEVEIGGVNMQFYATIDNNLEGGQFRHLLRELGYEIGGNLPGFSDYEELKVLLQKHFEIYEDLKKELLKEV